MGSITPHLPPRYFFNSFCLEITFDLPQSCKGSTEFPHVFHPTSPNVNIFQNHDAFY